MSTIAATWDAFMRALAEASDLHRRKDNPAKIADALRLAREALEILEDELAARLIPIPANECATFAQLRARLERLEKDIMPTRHCTN